MTDVMMTGGVDAKTNAAPRGLTTDQQQTMTGSNATWTIHSPTPTSSYSAISRQSGGRHVRTQHHGLMNAPPASAPVNIEPTAALHQRAAIPPKPRRHTYSGGGNRVTQSKLSAELSSCVAVHPDTDANDLVG